MEIALDWRKLARRLLKGDETQDGHRYPFVRPSVKAYKMLRDWKAAKGSDATFQVLHDALCHHSVNRRDLAQKYCFVY